MRPFTGICAAVLCTLAPLPALAAPGDAAFVTAASIPAPDGKWDFASWDDTRHRLLVAHGGNVLIVDPATGSVKTMGEIAGAHAVLAIPGGNRILVTSAHDATARVIDAETGLELAHIAVAADPDAAVLSADGRTAYVMGADSGNVSVIDLSRYVEIARHMLKPGLEAPVLASPTLLAVNNEKLGEIELLDLATGAQAGTIAMPGCEGPTGLAYAPKLHVALSACANGKAALLDMVRRRLIELIPIGTGPDTAIWDARRGRFLVPCGKSGTLSVIAVDAAGARPLSAVTTTPSARTAALDPETGRLYLPAARFNLAPSGQRPTMVAGSFRILVLNPAD